MKIKGLVVHEWKNHITSITDSVATYETLPIRGSIEVRRFFWSKPVIRDVAKDRFNVHARWIYMDTGEYVQPRGVIEAQERVLILAEMKARHG